LGANIGRLLGGFMTEQKFISEQIYDYLMENSYERIDFVKNFPESFIDYDECTIYLLGSDALKNYKITIKEVNHA